MVSIVGSVFVWGAYVATYKQVVEARRQADAAVASLPRAWLFVDFPRTLDIHVEPSKEAGGRRSLRVTVPFSLIDYGQLPGTIIQMDAKMFVASSDAPMPGFPFDADGRRMAEFATSASVQPAWGRYCGQVVTLSQPLSLSQEFLFDDQPNLKTSPEKLQRWISVLVRYRDPFGDRRDTSLLGRVGEASVTDTDDKRYNYQR